MNRKELVLILSVVAGFAPGFAAAEQISYNARSKMDSGSSEEESAVNPNEDIDANLDADITEVMGLGNDLLKAGERFNSAKGAKIETSQQANYQLEAVRRFFPKDSIPAGTIADYVRRVRELGKDLCVKSSYVEAIGHYWCKSKSQGVMDEFINEIARTNADNDYFTENHIAAERRNEFRRIWNEVEKKKAEISGAIGNMTGRDKYIEAMTKKAGTLVQNENARVGGARSRVEKKLAEAGALNQNKQPAVVGDGTAALPGATIPGKPKVKTQAAPPQSTPENGLKPEAPAPEQKKEQQAPPPNPMDQAVDAINGMGCQSPLDIGKSKAELYEKKLKNDQKAKTQGDLSGKEGENKKAAEARKKITDQEALDVRAAMKTYNERMAAINQGHYGDYKSRADALAAAAYDLSVATTTAFRTAAAAAKNTTSLKDDRAALEGIKKAGEEALGNITKNNLATLQEWGRRSLAPAIDDVAARYQYVPSGQPMAAGVGSWNGRLKERLGFYVEDNELIGRYFKEVAKKDDNFNACLAKLENKEGVPTGSIDAATVNSKCAILDGKAGGDAWAKPVIKPTLLDFIKENRVQKVFGAQTSNALTKEEIEAHKKLEEK